MKRIFAIILVTVFTVPCFAKDAMKDLQPTRRVTTGINQQGQSCVIADEQVNTQVPYPIWPSFQLQDLFYTADTEQSITTRHKDNQYSL